MKYFVVFLISNLYLIGFDFIEGADWYVMQFGNSVSMLILFYIIFIKTPLNKINERSVLALFMYYQIYGILSYWTIVLSANIPLYPFYIVLIIFLVRFITINTRAYSGYSDFIKENNVYLCLEKPLKTRGVFTSLLGSPFCSVSVYYNGFLYGFKWSLPKYMKRHVSYGNLKKKYLIINTGKDSEKLKEKLESLIGQEASFCKTRIKCVWIIKDFLTELGPQYKPDFIEYIPSIYAKKIIGLNNGKTS